MRARKLFTRYFTIAVIVFVLTGCAPNSFSIRLAYSRLDNNLYSRLNEYATFDDEQRTWIRSAAIDYQKWHRKTELPEYAEFFGKVAALLETNLPVGIDSVISIFETLESFSRRSYSQSPFANSVSFLSKITDSQVQQIASSFAEQNRQQLAHIRKHAELPGNQDRVDKIAKTFSRFGLSLNQDQRAIVENGLNKYVGDREDRVYAWQVWEGEFIRLLETRHQPGFAELMQQHIDQYQLQMELRFPARAHRNRDTAIETVVLLLNSLDATQRTSLANTLRDSSKILIAMGNSKQTEIL
jgi:hypothetical protein